MAGKARVAVLRAAVAMEVAVTVAVERVESPEEHARG